MAFADPKKIIEELELTAGQEVADFGAGAGYFALAASDKVGEDGVVYVIDIQQDLLTKAKHHATPGQLKSLRFIQGDLEEEQGSHIGDGLCDAVIMTNILFQLEKKAACLKEAFRVLRSGGQLLITDWSDSFGGIGPQEEYLFSKEKTVDFAKSVGFELVREFDAGGYHYGLVFKKP
jgi:ubiquinone/menaquinone biosynthesis C-methylase UbiE